jgi:hypothetical protein
MPPGQITRLPRDPAAQTLVEQKMLTERFARVQPMSGDHVAQGWQHAVSLQVKRRIVLYLKKRTKKLLLSRCHQQTLICLPVYGTKHAKVFWFFFSKKNTFFSHCPA